MLNTMKILYSHKSHPVEPLGIGYLSSSIAGGGHESRGELASRAIHKALNHISVVM